MVKAHKVMIEEAFLGASVWSDNQLIREERKVVRFLAIRCRVDANSVQQGAPGAIGRGRCPPSERRVLRADTPRSIS